MSENYTYKKNKFKTEFYNRVSNESMNRTQNSEPQ